MKGPTSQELKAQVELLERQLDGERQANRILTRENSGLTRTANKLLARDYLGVARDFEKLQGREQKLNASRMLISLAVLQEQPQHLEQAQSLLVELQDEQLTGATFGDHPATRPEGPEELHDRVLSTQRELDESRAAFQARRRSRAELITGGVMGGVVLASAALFARTVSWHSLAQERIALQPAGASPQYLSELRAFERTTETCMVASAIAGTFALVLSATLIAIGIRDRSRLRTLQLSMVR
ncbi:hypothetical protein [Nannocystis bainbridge]|uniref:Uncharacterized protein n=1 Tax=Nannocystis bainbridge TaxID=2995303 RepID=A0ABT5DRB4_9BACT|nr:hypothetical protein [Nannocystis bainbridge]MDC0716153.1 hypothetical protein [Nannocystis bainbridge]